MVYLLFLLLAGVANRRERRGIRRQRHRWPAPSLPLEAPRQLRRKVLLVRRRTAVAADKNLRPAADRLNEQLAGLLNDVGGRIHPLRRFLMFL